MHVSKIINNLAYYLPTTVERHQNMRVDYISRKPLDRENL